MTYQDDLVRRLHGPQGERWTDPGYAGPMQNPGSATPAPTPVQAAPNASDPRAFLASVLGGQQYGMKGLEAAKPQLEQAGYRVQFGDGFTRGRVYDPSGRQWDVFDQAEGRTLQDNWSNNPRGTKWDIRDSGMPTAGGSAPSSGGGANFQSGIARLLSGDPTSRIQSALSQYTGQSDYLKQLLAQLGAA